MPVVRNMQALRVREIRAHNRKKAIETAIKKNELCPYCGTRLSIEREVFENDRLFKGHNCRGKEE